MFEFGRRRLVGSVTAWQRFVCQSKDLTTVSWPFDGGIVWRALTLWDLATHGRKTQATNSIRSKNDGGGPHKVTTEHEGILKE